MGLWWEFTLNWPVLALFGLFIDTNGRNTQAFLKSVFEDVNQKEKGKQWSLKTVNIKHCKWSQTVLQMFNLSNAVTISIEKIKILFLFSLLIK